MKTLLLMLAVPAALLSTYLLATGFGVYQRYPIPALILAFVALFFLFKETRATFSYPKLGANLLAWGFLFLYSWWAFVFSEYGAAKPPVTVGAELSQRFARMDMTLADGNQMDMRDLISDSRRGTLLVFFRGHW